MLFVVKERINAPVDDVFAAITHFDRYEREAAANGIAVMRTGRSVPGPGMGWNAEFLARGRVHILDARISEMRAPEVLSLDGKVSGMVGRMQVHLAPLGDDQTEARIEIHLEARTFGARLAIEAMRLTKGRFRRRIQDSLRLVERQLVRRPVFG